MTTKMSIGTKVSKFWRILPQKMLLPLFRTILDFKTAYEAIDRISPLSPVLEERITTAILSFDKHTSRSVQRHKCASDVLGIFMEQIRCAAAYFIRNTRNKEENSVLALLLGEHTRFTSSYKRFRKHYHQSPTNSSGRPPLDFANTSELLVRSVMRLALKHEQSRQIEFAQEESENVL